MTPLKPPRRLTRPYLVASTLPLLLTVVATGVRLFVLVFVLVGVTNVLIVSVIQAVVPETLLGRVTAVLGSASAVSTPFGALAGGTTASLVGPLGVITVADVGFLFLAFYLASVPQIRQLPAVGDIDTLAASQ